MQPEVVGDVGFDWGNFLTTAFGSFIGVAGAAIVVFLTYRTNQRLQQEMFKKNQELIEQQRQDNVERWEHQRNEERARYFISERRQAYAVFLGAIQTVNERLSDAEMFLLAHPDTADQVRSPAEGMVLLYGSVPGLHDAIDQYGAERIRVQLVASFAFNSAVTRIDNHRMSGRIEDMTSPQRLYDLWRMERVKFATLYVECTQLARSDMGLELYETGPLQGI